MIILRQKEFARIGGKKVVAATDKIISGFKRAVQSGENYLGKDAQTTLNNLSVNSTKATGDLLNSMPSSDKHFHLITESHGTHARKKKYPPNPNQLTLNFGGNKTKSGSGISSSGNKGVKNKKQAQDQKTKLTRKSSTRGYIVNERDDMIDVISPAYRNGTYKLGGKQWRLFDYSKQ